MLWDAYTDLHSTAVVDRGLVVSGLSGDRQRPLRPPETVRKAARQCGARLGLADAPRVWGGFLSNLGGFSLNTVS